MWENKLHRPDMLRTKSTEGKFENVEEFIRVDCRVTMDEFSQRLGLNRGSVRTVIYKS